MVLTDQQTGRSIESTLWTQRHRELVDAYRAAHQTFIEAVEAVADAAQELKEAAEAPAREAPLYGRESRPMPFSPDLLQQQITSALRRRGVYDKKRR